MTHIFLNSKQFSLRTIKAYIDTSKKINLKVKEININTMRLAIKNLDFFNVQRTKTILNFAYKYRYINERISDFIINAKPIPKKTRLFDKTLLRENDYQFRNGVYLNDIVVFLLETGLRLNEMISITFDRVFEDYILIDRQIVYDNGEWHWVKLKSKNSERKIPITDNVKKIIEKQPYIETGFLFGGVQKMTLARIEYVMKREYNINPHALRHTHASYLIEYSYEVLGYCDKDNIAKHMGHTVAMLESTYKHLFRDKKDEIKQVLNYVFKKY